jgi:hypothetical protein
MSARLLNKDNRNLTTVSELENGQIAIMVNNAYAGTIVQRYGDNCVAIGNSSEHGWSGCNNNTLTVRILEDGELIKIFNNQ